MRPPTTLSAWTVDPGVTARMMLRRQAWAPGVESRCPGSHSELDTGHPGCVVMHSEWEDAEDSHRVIPAWFQGPAAGATWDREAMPGGVQVGDGAGLD